MIIRLLILAITIPISYILILYVILIFCTSALFFSKFPQRARDTREWRKEVADEPPLGQACVCLWRHSCCPVSQVATRSRDRNRCRQVSSSAIPQTRRRISWVYALMLFSFNFWLIIIADGFVVVTFVNSFSSFEAIVSLVID